MTGLLSIIRAAVHHTDKADVMPVGEAETDSQAHASAPQLSQSSGEARLRGILSSEKAKSNMDLANYLAFETSVSEAQASEILTMASSTKKLTLAEAYEEERMAAQVSAVRHVNPLAALASARPSSSGHGGGGLVANMKRRHGIK